MWPKDGLLRRRLPSKGLLQMNFTLLESNQLDLGLRGNFTRQLYSMSLYVQKCLRHKVGEYSLNLLWSAFDACKWYTLCSPFHTMLISWRQQERSAEDIGVLEGLLGGNVGVQPQETLQVFDVSWHWSWKKGRNLVEDWQDLAHQCQAK